MAARYLLKVQRHAPNPAMAAYQPVGMDAFYAEAVDKDNDDHGYIGFYGPPTLFDNLDAAAGQARLCAWLAKGVLEDEDQAAAALVYSALLNQPKDNLLVKAEVTHASGGLSWVAFSWIGALPLHGLVKSAESEERAIALDVSFPVAPSAARPKL